MTPAALVLVIVALAFGLGGPGSAQPVVGPPLWDGPPGGPGPTLPPPEETPGIDLKEPMWVAVQGQTTGPFEPQVIAQKIVAGEIVAETLVYTGSMNRWLPAGDVAALQPLIRQVAERRGPRRGGLPKRPQEDDKELAARLTEYMLGQWEFDAPISMPGMTSRMSLRYRPDGTIRGYVTSTKTGERGKPETNTALRTGTWMVEPINSRRFVLLLTFVVDGKEGPLDLPFEIMGPSRKRHLESDMIAIRTAY